MQNAKDKANLKAAREKSLQRKSNETDIGILNSKTENQEMK